MPSIEDVINPNYPARAPWIPCKQVIPNSNLGTLRKPAICHFRGQIFLAWATHPTSSSPTLTFSWTKMLPSGNGWAPPTEVPIGRFNTQTFSSTMVVFKNALYLFVPWESTNNKEKGCGIYKYNEATSAFDYSGNWSATWCTSLSAVEHQGTLHVVGYNTSDGNHLVWTYSDPNTTAITGPGGFSANIKINESSTSNPALVVRDGRVRLMFLSSGDTRAVLEISLTMGNSPSWARTDKLHESGNSGISAVSSTGGDHAWICFKEHNGVYNLICQWKQRQGSWTTNQPLGESMWYVGYNEAALAFSDNWVYAVWNTSFDGNPMYWSRRPIGYLNPESWMGQLVDQNISMADLSIPGTHDSATSAYHGLSAAESLVRCQDMTIAQQLNAGIRYFDLRASQPIQAIDPITFTLNSMTGYRDLNSSLIAVHGDFGLGLTIREIFSIFYDWLDNHPTEAIVVQVKAEGKGVNKQAVSNDLGALIKDKSRYWAIGETVPSLAQIRGKIQLVRRVDLPIGYGVAETFGINALGWPENTQNEIKNTLINSNSTPVRLWIEDNYTFYDLGATALQKKTKYITDFVAKAVSSPKSTTDPVWFIGFSSYSTTGGIPDSNFHYAAKSLGGNKAMNEALETYVRLQGGYSKPARVGTLLMDYPNWNSGTLIESIIYTNDLNLAG